MRICFIILSIAYIVGIFLFADSSAVSSIAAFNPYSLLHIPLYGILSLLLFLSIAPYKLMKARRTSQSNDLGEEGRTNRISQTHQTNQTQWTKYFILAGCLASGLAAVDEYNQSFIPSRTASIGDVFLDLIGILVFLFLLSRFMKSRKHLILGRSTP